MFISAFKLNLKRFWWISALNTFLLLLFFIFPLFQYEYVDYCNPDGGLIMLAILFGAVNGWAVFSYLNSTRTVNLYHSMPTTRTGLFAANAVFGAISTAVPNLVPAILIPVIIKARNQDIDPEQIGYISENVSFGWIVLNTFVLGLVIFALSCFVAMFTGNSVAAKVFTPIIAALPFVVEGIIAMFRSEFLYGSRRYYDLFLMDFFSNDLEYTPLLITYLILIPVLLLLAYVAYRLRPMETAGEIVTFRWARGLFIQGTALCFGILITSITYAGINFLLITLIGMVFGAIAMMLMQKTLRIKGWISQLVIFLVIIAGLFAVFKLDITGYEKRIPKKASAVESVTLDSLGQFGSDFTVDDPELIENVISAHKYIVENRDLDSYSTVTIDYKLKNGRSLQRSYEFPYEAYKKYFSPIVLSDEFKANEFGLDRTWTAATVTWYSLATDDEPSDNIIYSHDLEYARNEIKLSADQITALRAALEADLAEANDFDKLYIEAAYSTDNNSPSIDKCYEISYFYQFSSKNDDPIIRRPGAPYAETYEGSSTPQITPWMTRTCAVIQDIIKASEQKQ